MFRVDDILGIQKKTRADLSKTLNIPLSSLTKWAKSQKSVPDARTIGRIALYLETSTDLLILGCERDYVEIDKSKFPQKYVEVAKKFLGLPPRMKDVLIHNTEVLFDFFRKEQEEMRTEKLLEKADDATAKDKSQS